MKLSELAKKPTLVKIVIDNPEIVEKYGEELEFFIYDRQPIDIFTKLAVVNKENAGNYIDILKHIILDENGNSVITEELSLPLDVLTEAMRLIGDHLGK